MPMIGVKTPRCIVCGANGELVVDKDAYFAWQNGLLLQKAMPGLSGEDREQLISGVHRECWEDLYGVEV